MRIRDTGWEKFGSGIPDSKKSYPGSGMVKSRIRDKKKSGSATRSFLLLKICIWNGKRSRCIKNLEWFILFFCRCQQQCFRSIFIKSGSRPGFLWPKTKKKNLIAKIWNFLWLKIAWYIFLKVFSCFLILWVTLACLDLDFIRIWIWNAGQLHQYVSDTVRYLVYCIVWSSPRCKLCWLIWYR